MFDVSKREDGGYEERYVVVKTVTFRPVYDRDLDETLVLIRTTSLFNDRQPEYCWMQAGAALKCERTSIATFDNTTVASLALGKLVERWGPQAISGDEDSTVVIDFKSIMFNVIEANMEAPEGAYAFNVIHNQEEN